MHLQSSGPLRTAVAGLVVSSFALAQAPSANHEEDARLLPEPQSVYLPTARLDDAPVDRTPPRPDLTRTSLFHRTGLHERDGILVGGGPDYEVNLRPEGVEFIPGLGRAAPRTYPMTFSLESFGRDGSTRRVESVAPTFGDRTAAYARPGFTETYEMRLDGMKQSFVFDRLPAGTGDLVVRGRLGIELEPRWDGDELVFDDGQYGGVRIGSVVGIDARGERVDGSMRYEEGVLEMSLPADFVDRAELPLELDPLIGSVITIRASANDDADPDIAYDLTNDVYLVVWEYFQTTSNANIRAQLVTGAGSPTGGTIFLDSTTTHDLDPSVANVTTEDGFAVIWRVSASPGYIVGRAIDASNGSVGARTTIISGTDSYSSPDVGGEAVLDDEVIVVFENLTDDEIQAKQVTVNTDVSPPTLSPFAATVLIGDADPTWINFDPAISKSGGSTGHHLIVWNRSPTSDIRAEVRGVIVNRNLGILDNFISISGSFGSDYDDDDPEVDGDGRQWCVAWERSEDTAGTSADDDIVCRIVRFDPNSTAPNQGITPGPIVVVEAGASDDEQDVQVAWTANSVLLAFRDEAASRYDFELHSLDNAACTTCEGIFSGSFPTTGVSDLAVAVCAAESGEGDTVDRPRALMAIESTDTTTFNGDILARLFEAEDGATRYLGGGCGAEAGLMFASCATPGNADFQFLQRGAEPSSSTWLAFSFETFGYGCGSCTLVPNVFNGWVVPRSTNAAGDAEVVIPVPSSGALVGLRCYAQWLTADAVSPSCTAWQADLTSAVEVTIQ